MEVNVQETVAKHTQCMWTELYLCKNSYEYKENTFCVVCDIFKQLS